MVIHIYANLYFFSEVRIKYNPIRLIYLLFKISKVYSMSMQIYKNCLLNIVFTI